MRRPKHLPNYTVQDYRSWQGDWELIDGIPYAMSPSPKVNHQFLAGQLYLQIGNDIKKKKKICSDCRYLYEVDWIVDDGTVVRPDISVICGKTGDFITSPPVLIIEILSLSTALNDRNTKFGIYEKQGVKYYILVNPDTKTYTIYVLKNKRYGKQNKLKSFIIHDTCAIDLDIDNVLSELK
jgi:Uma2 family endonuclease